jgi:ATPase subunit of ABC transporter with duplicated ATPase domains
MAISSDDYRDDLREFARRAPQILAQHAVTRRLADDVKRLDLVAQLERRQFTVAVVGRMKAGKSTLLNALVGRPLAPVGVNETTATVNWFDHGATEREAACEIHWKDEGRPMEVRPVADICELTGRSAEAREIDHIRFFTDSPFLRGVRLVDAPGTMSTIDSHV